MLEKLAPADRSVVQGALQRAEKTEAELRFLADHDSLTGLLNRRRFRVELDQYVSFTARYGGRGAVMVIDIDGLKQVNDSLGHQAGDRLIRRVAEILRERVRATDLVARLSGDEFAVLMPQTDTAGAMQLGEDLRYQVAEGLPLTSTSATPRLASGSRCSAVRPGWAPRRCWSPPTRRCIRPRPRDATGSALPLAGRERRAAKRAQTTSARIRDAITQTGCGWRRSRSAASPPAGSSATSCCCG